MFVKLTDGRVAYTDNADFFFILTEPLFHLLTDSGAAPPQHSSGGADSGPPTPPKTPPSEN